MGWHRSSPRNALNPGLAEAGRVGGVIPAIGEWWHGHTKSEEFGKALTHWTPLHWRFRSNFQQNYPVSQFMVCFIHFPQPKDNVLCKIHPLCMTGVLTGAVSNIIAFIHALCISQAHSFPGRKFPFFFFLSLVEWAQGGRKTWKILQIVMETFFFPFLKGDPPISMDRSSRSCEAFQVLTLNWISNPGNNEVV